jgi:hypothetical protein
MKERLPLRGKPALLAHTTRCATTRCGATLAILLLINVVSCCGVLLDLGV